MRYAVTLLAAAAMLFAGCGDDSGTDTGADVTATPAADATPAPTATAEPVVDDETQIKALVSELDEVTRDGDGEAGCKLMTPAAQRAVLVGAAYLGVQATDCPTAYSSVLKVQKAEKYTLTSIEVDGETATATNNEGSTEYLARVDGRWLLDAEQQIEGEELRAAAKKWPAAWCKVKPGDSRAAIRKTMGKPVESYDESDEWSGFGVSMTVFYDADLRARQLQVGEGADKVKCARVRTP